jgi:NADPH-dependent curcumin reductase CurA
MGEKNLQLRLARRPVGWIQESDFRFVEQPLPVPLEGQVLLRNLYLSRDPYTRGRMNARNRMLRASASARP